MEIELEKTIRDEEQSEKPKKKNGCLKSCFIVLILLFILALGGLFVGWKALSTYLGTTDKPSVPTITIESGTVNKKVGSDVWSPLGSGQSLTDGDTIRSEADSDATISFPNGSVIRLDENTQVTINATMSKISISQELGRTWSRVEKLLGKNDAFEVETPTAVATVRGTAFSTTVTTDNTHVETDENEVEVAAIERIGDQRNILHAIVVDAGNNTWVRTEDMADLKSGKKKLIKEAIKEEVKNSDWFKRNRDRDKKIIQTIRKKGANPLELLNLIRTSSPRDLLKLRAFLERVGSGRLQLSEAQQEQLAALGDELEGESLSPDVAARMLAIIDPVNFSDTDHWAQVLRPILPIILQTGKLPEVLNQTN